MWQGIKNFLGQYWAAGIILLSPIKAALCAIIFIVLVDLILGIIRAKKQQIKITSNKLRRTLIKLLCYLLVFIVSYVLELYLIPFIELSKIVASFIGLVEFKSILENLNIISGGKVWKAILHRLSGPSMKDKE